MNRAIKNAILKETCKKIYADEYFSNLNESHKKKGEFDKKNSPYSCCECDQDLMLYSSSMGGVFFKHYPNSHDCFLKDNLTPKLIEEIERINYARESDRHIELKGKLHQLLLKHSDFSNVAEEEWIITKNGKRKPDVYGFYLGHTKIAFEIQLSPMSANYMNKRARFYIANGIKVFWIFDNPNPKKQKQWQKDIKYLNIGQNLFSLDESSENLSFNCFYKEPFISYNEVHTKWRCESVKTEELKFEGCSPYYFDSPSYIDEKEIELQELLFEREVNQKKIQKYREEVRELEQNLKSKEAEVRSAKINFESSEDKLSQLKNTQKEINTKVEELYTEILTDRPFFGYDYQATISTFGTEKIELIKEINREEKKLKSEINKLQKEIENIQKHESVEIDGVIFKILPSNTYYNLNNIPPEISIYKKQGIHSSPKKIIPDNERIRQSILRNKDKMIYVLNHSPIIKEKEEAIVPFGGKIAHFNIKKLQFKEELKEIYSAKIANEIQNRNTEVTNNKQKYELILSEKIKPEQALLEKKSEIEWLESEI